jgi:hypothetical protein
MDYKELQPVKMGYDTAIETFDCGDPDLSNSLRHSQRNIYNRSIFQKNSLPLRPL